MNAWKTISGLSNCVQRMSMRTPCAEVARYGDSPRQSALPRQAVAALFGLAVAIATLWPVPSYATLTELDPIEFSAPELVDVDVESVGSGAGTIAIDFGGWVHVFYVKNQVVHVRRWNESSGWAAPESVSSPGEIASNPKVAADRDQLHVVWQQNQFGHPEVLTRRWNGVDWSPEECLTCDGVESVNASVGGDRNHVIVVWEDRAAGPGDIFSRLWDRDAKTWGSLEVVATGSDDQTQPSVFGARPAYIVWTDDRWGRSEVFYRVRGYSTWGPEVQVTDAPTGNRTRPDVYKGECCGDAPSANVRIFYENDSSGVREIESACVIGETISSYQSVSPVDGIPSTAPSADGYGFYNTFFLGSVSVRFAVTWTDLFQDNRSHHLAHYYSCTDSDGAIGEIAAIGESNSIVTSAEASGPRQEIRTFWISEAGGTTRLFTQRGLALDCLDFQQGGPNSLLVTPSGNHVNQMSSANHCQGVEGWGEWAVFSPAQSILNGVNWDVEQTLPLPDAPIDPQTGEFQLSMRGGGCVDNGPFYIRVNSIVILSYTGVKSPDIDGDCAVRDSDVEYVESMLGTDDFCADLDGTGLVDEADVAIVTASLGESCSQVSGLETADIAAALQVHPNPSRTGTSVEFADSRNTPRVVEIFDVAGRVVQRLQAPAGAARIEWNLADRDGVPLPSGTYWVRARGETTGARPLIIVR